MSEQPKTRQELYDLIKLTSKKEYILSEMKRLGFWDEDKGVEVVPPELKKEQKTLQKEMDKLLKAERNLTNPEQIIKDYRAKRMKESREKQAENLKKRIAANEKKKADWQEKKKKEITYLGEDVSHQLNDAESDKKKLKKYNLPIFKDAADLAKAMKIEMGHLRFLSYNRKVSTVSHYKRFYMQKKSGGQRLISAPMPLLKQSQYWILENILDKIPVHDAANGFLKERSIVSNAKPHIGQDVVVNFDFKDFFPTLTFNRVRGAFRSLGYSGQVATILACLCTEPEVDEVKMENKIFYIHSGERHLPQGAPTSPMLTNIICYKLDKRNEGMAQNLGFAYTRYADDMSFSASGESKENLQKLIYSVRAISKAEGFNLHPDKLRIMRKGSRQEVTGIVVNNKAGINRNHLRKFRALLHQIEKDGPKGKQWGSSPNLAEAVWGYANFVYMVKPEQGKKLLDKVKKLFGKQSSSGKLDRNKTQKTQLSEYRKVVASDNNAASKDPLIHFDTTQEISVEDAWRIF